MCMYICNQKDVFPFMSVYAFSENNKCLCIHLHSSHNMCIYRCKYIYLQSAIYVLCFMMCYFTEALTLTALAGNPQFFFLLEKYGESWRG